MRGLLCLLILASAASADTSVSATSARARRSRPVGYIVPAARGAEFLSGAKRYWTPTQDEVDRLEDHLVTHLKDTRAGDSFDLWKRIARYGRQYVGLLDAKGHKKIWVNLFVLDEEFAKDIRRQLIDVDDGGDGFCRITWDVASSAFSDFNCNSPG